MLGVAHHSAQTYINIIPNGLAIAVQVAVHIFTTCETLTDTKSLMKLFSHWIYVMQIGQSMYFYNMCFFDLWTVQGDVYPVEPYESSSMNQVLDAHWGVLDDDDDDVSLEISIIWLVFSDMDCIAVFIIASSI